MTAEEQLRKLVDAAEPERLMDDAEYERVGAMAAADIVKLPEAVLARYAATARWANEERITFNSMTGFTVGGKSAADYLKEKRGA